MSAGLADWLEAPNPPLSLSGSQDHGVTEDQQLPRKEPWSSPRHLFICSTPTHHLMLHLNFHSYTFSTLYFWKQAQIKWTTVKFVAKVACVNWLCVFIFSMFVWTYAYGGARFIVSVASCLVFPVFVGPFCWVKWPCLTWCSLLFPPPQRTKAGLGGLCRDVLYCFAQLSTALHTYHTNQHLLV